MTMTMTVRTLVYEMRQFVYKCCNGAVDAESVAGAYLNITTEDAEDRAFVEGFLCGKGLFHHYVVESDTMIKLQTTGSQFKDEDGAEA